jgi:hypothetical protein
MMSALMLSVTREKGGRGLLMSCVLNNESNILVLGKLEACSDVCRRGNIDRVVNVIAQCAGCCLRSIRIAALEIRCHDGRRRRKPSFICKQSCFKGLKLTESVDSAILLGGENIVSHCRWDRDKVLLRESS